MARVPLGSLPYFVQVARLGNLSRAAEQAHLTVSALSHQIHQLERRLERKLFDRSPRGMQLTQAGRQLLDAVAEHMDGLERAMTDYQCRHDNRIGITGVPGMLTGWLVPRLGDLVRQHPDLQLDLSSTEMLVDFEREPFDLGLRYGSGQWQGLHSERLFGEWIVPVAAPALLQRYPQAVETLSELPLLGDIGGKWDAWFRHMGGQPPTRYVARFDTADSQQRAALEGIGVALARMVVAQPLIEAGLLQVLGERYLHINEAYYLVYPERSRAHSGFLRFRSWLLEQAAGHEALMRRRVQGAGHPRQGGPLRNIPSSSLQSS